MTPIPTPYNLGENYDPSHPHLFFECQSLILICILKTVPHPYQILPIFLAHGGHLNQDLERCFLSKHAIIAHTCIYIFTKAD